MINYEKLEIAHQMIKETSYVFDATFGLEELWLVLRNVDDEREDYNIEIEFYDIDDLIAKLTELTKPEQKYKVGDAVYTYGMTIQDWTIDLIYYEPDNNDFRVNLSNPNGKASVMQSQLYPTRQSLIEAQIDYWQNLLNEEKPTSSCCSAHAGSTEECRHEFENQSGSYNSGPCSKCIKCHNYVCGDGSISINKNTEECQHESDGFLYLRAERDITDFKFNDTFIAVNWCKCIKCGAYYK